ncbi:MAG: hypothetical protein KF779_12465 [Hyphomonadaceae bacterium]|nr:hypothetical protein [Hyphomonadaceae bacterium]MCA8885782.1 hypothetical protein [Hyphomonadaceae bacterium]
MTQGLEKLTWMARLRAVIGWPRARHYAALTQDSSPTSVKLAPIAEILAKTGRNPPVD